MDNGQYRNMLLEVGDSLDEEELRKMKFRCDKIIKKRESEKITHATELFTALEQREHLSPFNTEFLKELLKTCCSGKIDSLRLVENFERTRVNGHHVQNFPVQPNIIPQQMFAASQQAVYVVQDSTQLPGRNLREPNRPRYGGPDLTQEITFLTKKLGRDWKFFFRALKLHEDEIETICCDYRNMRERIQQCLLSWQDQEKQNASKQQLINALRDQAVQRNDLASELENLH